MKRAGCPSLSGASLLACAALLAAGCTLGPNYQRPSMATPDAWRNAAAPAADAGTLANTPWWDLFKDPQLQALIRIALQENQDLRVAIERIVEARARVGYVRADLFPKVDAGANAGYFEQSREAFPGIAKGTDNSSADYQLFADMSWEIDLFGRIRRATESERAILLSTEETRRAVAISLVAAVARSYVELRDLDERLEIARRTLVSRAHSVDLATVRFRGGLTGEKDQRQAEAEYRRVEVSALDFERQVRQKESELAVLLGRPPGDIARGRKLAELPVAMQIPAGLPSQLVDRRPDVLAVEQQLHSTTADVGAAKAMLFPRIALTAGYGTSSAELDALFTGPAQAWSVAAGVLQPVFNAGRNLRRVEIAESRMRQSLYEYEKTVLEALREVEDGLVAWEKTGQQRGSQRARVEAERKVLQLSEARWEGGVADYLEVLDAQRSLFSAELDEVQTVSAQMVSLVQLYKALGGGWPTAPAAAPLADDVPSNPR